MLSRPEKQRRAEKALKRMLSHHLINARSETVYALYLACLAEEQRRKRRSHNRAKL